MPRTFASCCTPDQLRHSLHVVVTILCHVGRGAETIAASECQGQIEAGSRCIKCLLTTCGSACSLASALGHIYIDTEDVVCDLASWLGSMAAVAQ